MKRASLGLGLALGAMSWVACSPQIAPMAIYQPADAGSVPAPTTTGSSLPPLPNGYTDGGLALGDAGFYMPADGGLPPLGLPGPDGGGLAFDAGLGNAVFFSGGAPASLTALPGDPAYVCNEGGGRCIDMIRYWPAPAPGTMFVKNWDDMLAPQAGDYRAANQNLRTQAFLHLTGSPANEYALTEHMSGPSWTFATWQDTWHFRYDANTVIEFKDDVNLSTMVLPRLQGVQFSRMAYQTGQELRWGARLANGVMVPSPSHAVTTDFATGTVSPVRTFDMYAANAFSLVDVLDNVIANGTRYDKVAVVRVDQRMCRPNTACAYDPTGTFDYIVNYMYLGVGIGPIVNIGYAAQRDASGGLVFNGNFTFELAFGEVMTKSCTQAIPAPAPEVDTDLAMNAAKTASPPPPRCP